MEDSRPLSPRAGASLLCLAIFAGVVCRVAQYASDRSFWNDEAELVFNIRNHTARELLGPLDNYQAAPPLFLLAERGIFRWLGGSEYALRILPLACGIVSLFLFARLARRIVPPRWDALAVGFFALGDHFIWHSVEVKPYALDLLVAVLLTLLMLVPPTGTSPSRRLAWTAGIATVAMGCSYTTILVFAPLSAALFPSVAARSLRGWLRYALLNLPVAISLLLVLLVSMRAQRGRVLVDYWQADFVNLHQPGLWPLWLARHLHALCNYTLPGAAPVTLAGLLLGIFALIKSRQSQLQIILAGPIAVALLAAAAHSYPFDGARLTFFLSGAILLLATIGFRWLWLQSTGWLRPLMLLLPGYMLAITAVWAGIHLVEPRNRGHLRPVAAYLRSHVLPDDQLYVLERWEFQCYWPANDPRIRWSLDPADRIAARRFWIISSLSDDDSRHRRDRLLGWAGGFATERQIFTVPGGAAVLFERNGNSPPPGHNDPPNLKKR